jgi:hypothetical protein
MNHRDTEAQRLDLVHFDWLPGIPCPGTAAKIHFLSLCLCASVVSPSIIGTGEISVLSAGEIS